MPLLQIAVWLELIPPWLPTVTVATGALLILLGTVLRFVRAYVSSPSHSISRPLVLANTIGLAIAGATFVSVRRQELVLLFVLLVFTSGRIIQGAIAARFVQKVLQFLETTMEGTTPESWSVQTYQYLRRKIRDRLVIVTVSGIITLFVVGSIATALASPTLGLPAAIRRFWVGFFLLLAAGLVFDFRYFAHRMPWTVSVGLVLAMTGAFLYSPVNFSTITAAISPYLDTPIPGWARAPLGMFGFLAGVIFWAIFYRKQR